MKIEDAQTETLAILLWNAQCDALDMRNVSWLRLDESDRLRWRQIARGDLPIPDMP